MGRKVKELTEKEIGQVENLASLLNQEQIADFLGICSRTFRRLCERDDRVKTAYKKGKAAALVGVGQSLLKQARGGNTSAQMFYLKTQGGWREKVDINHQSEDGSMKPTVIELVSPEFALERAATKSDD